MHKILFRLGNFEIYSFSLFVAMGVMLALWAAIKAGEKQNISSKILLDLTIYLIISGSLGARLLYVIIKWKDYASTPLEILNFRAGGLSLHGAFLGGLLALYWFSKQNKLSPVLLLDLLSPSVALGIAIGRIGCFFNGCCLGVPTNMPWGVIFHDTIYPEHRHPTQIYEMFLDLILFLILLRLQNKQQSKQIIKDKPKSGLLVLLLFGGYSVIRFLIEFLREDPIIFAWLSLAQWGSLLIVAVVIVLWRLKYS